MARAGHEVMVFEQGNRFGGRLATVQPGNGPLLDYGISWFSAESDEYASFLQDLNQKKLLDYWTDHFAFRSREQYYPVHPSHPHKDIFAAPKGVHEIARAKGRWLDFYLEEEVSGLTFIGANRLKKRSWMINMVSINVFEVDAVIIAAPAIPAYGMIQTAQDETPIRKMIREVNEVDYDPCYSLMVTIDGMEQPEWQVLACQDDRLRSITCENSKPGREDASMGLVIRSTGEFARQHRDEHPEQVERLMLERAAELMESRVARPDWKRLHFWKYNEPRNPLDKPYIEIEDHPAPVALVGDYFSSHTVESSYLSGYHLARHWIEKYEPQLQT